jgi:hypothetical protein
MTAPTATKPRPRIKDSTGEFLIAWIAAAVAPAAGTVILLITPKPAPPRRDSVDQAATATS